MKSYRSKRRPGNRAMTAAQKARITAIKSKGCLACLQLGFDHDENAPQPDAHHLLSGGIRIGHDETVALCKWHHSARLTVEGWDAIDHLTQLGPALLQHPAGFKWRFGTDESLLAMQEAVLAGEWEHPRDNARTPSLRLGGILQDLQAPTARGPRGYGHD